MATSEPSKQGRCRKDILTYNPSSTPTTTNTTSSAPLIFRPLTVKTLSTISLKQPFSDANALPSMQKISPSLAASVSDLYCYRNLQAENTNKSGGSNHSSNIAGVGALSESNNSGFVVNGEAAAESKRDGDFGRILSRAHSIDGGSYKLHSGVNARWANNSNNITAAVAGAAYFKPRSNSLDTHREGHNLLSSAAKRLSTTFEEQPTPQHTEAPLNHVTYANITCSNQSLDPSIIQNHSQGHTDDNNENTQINTTQDIHKMTMTDNSDAKSAPGTLVRSRPPLPTRLSSKAINTAGDQPVGDLAGALSSFRSTDYVRKYSRKGRSSASTSGNVTPSLYTPILSPPSGCMSPTPAGAGSTGNALMTSSSAGNISSNFGAISLVKTRLEQMAQKQNNNDDNNENDNRKMDTSVENSDKLHNKQQGKTRNNTTLKSPSICDDLGHSLDESVDGISPLMTSSSPAAISAPGSTTDKFTASLSRSLPNRPFENENISKVQQEKGPEASTAKSLIKEKANEAETAPLRNQSQSSQLNQTHTDSRFSKATQSNVNNAVSQELELITVNDSKDTLPSATNQDRVVCADNVSVLRRDRLTGRKSLQNMPPSLDSCSECDSVRSSLCKEPPSSFDSTHDSVEDIALHLSESETASKASDNKINILDTDDEGVGAESPVVASQYKQVYDDVTKTSLLNRKSGKTGNERIAPINLDSLNTPIPGDKTSSIDRTIEEIPQSPRLANGRFLTHPPLTKLPTEEPGSLDSNGLGALRDPDNPMSSASDLTASLTSFDSHLCSSESAADTHFDQPIISDASLSFRYERRNSNKQNKQKSKSDPSGGQRIKAEDLTAVIQAHLKKQQQHNQENTSSRVPVYVVKDNEIGSKSKEKSKHSFFKKKPQLRPLEIQAQISDDSSSTDEAFVRAKKRSSKRRQRANSDKLPLKQISLVESGTKADVIQGGARSKTLPRFSSLSSASAYVTSDATLPRSAKIALSPEEHPIKRHLALGRSHSTASVVLLKDKFASYKGSSLVDKSVNRSGSRLGGNQNNSQGELGSPTRGKPTAFSPILRPIYSSSLSIFEGPEEGKTKRELIVKEFHSTEQQFVEALQIMVEKYMIPLKMQRIFDSSTIDTIFYKINEIYMHHATFLAFLERALASWSDETTIGDVICKNFSKQTVIESYMLFMDNFPMAEKRLDEINSKSAFQKFVEQVEKGINMKLPLKAQIVKPAQRIPRYELLIKRLLENTTEDHADFSYLKEAEEAIHHLAIRINSVKESKREEDFQETLKKLELVLLTDLVSADRQYLRHDMVQVLTRKDPVCMWLFNDLLVFSTVKRKSGPVNRKSSILLQSPSGHDFIDTAKQRLWFRFNIDDVEILKSDSDTEHAEEDIGIKENLESDFAVLSKMAEMTNELTCNHSMLKETMQELIAHINKQLSVIQLKAPPPEANQLNLVGTTENGEEHEMTVVFPNSEKRSQWESHFNEIKAKIQKVRNAKPPEFLQALQITKTRAGMQFTCAAAVIADQNATMFDDDDVTSDGGGLSRDVWVCNSDGYVGHMCLLSLQPEPIVTLNTPVPGCNSRITCICAVPPYSAQNSNRSRSNSTKSRRRVGVTSHLPPSIMVQNSTDFSEDGYVSDTSTSSGDDGMTESSTAAESANENVPERRHSDSSNHTMDSFTTEKVLRDPYKSLMWIGTEDGCIHIFPTNENIKTTKRKMKIQLSSSVLCIVCIENRVYVSLGNGELVVYKRCKAGSWDMSYPETVTLASTATPVNRMLCVAGRLWCVSYNDVMVVNPVTLETEVTFSGNSDTKRGIQCMASSGHCVCLSGCGSSRVQVFHATNYQLLQDINIAQAVTAQLLGTDEIIRQHKLACLRITSLLACRDVLWVGTSAGVIVTIPLPKVSSFVATRNSLQTQAPVITGVSQGHTGHVRFLACIEMPQTLSTTTGSSKPNSDILHRNNSMKTRSFSNKLLILSGGDGFEDTSVDKDFEDIGKDDSTNHLLLWQI